MSQQEAARRMLEIDAQIQQHQNEAIAAGRNPMQSDEYGELLVQWLEAAHAFYVAGEAVAA